MKKKYLVAALIVSMLANTFLLWKMMPKVKTTINEVLQLHINDWWLEDPYWQNKNGQFIKMAKVHPESTVFLGDSITEYFLTSEYFPELETINRGISGDTTNGIKSRIKESVIAIQPKQVFILMGTNDLKMNRSIDDIIKDYNSVLDTIIEKSPKTRIVVGSALPVRDRPERSNHDLKELNIELKKLTENKSITFVNLWPSFLDSDNKLIRSYSRDGLHLNGLGYQKLSEILRPHLN